MLTEDVRIRDPTPAKHSASESTVVAPGHQRGRTTRGGTLGAQGTIEVHPAAPGGAGRKRVYETPDFHQERYAAQDPDFPPSDERTGS